MNSKITTTSLHLLKSSPQKREDEVAEAPPTIDLEYPGEGLVAAPERGR
jgi:hypothetical protein